MIKPNKRKPGRPTSNPARDHLSIRIPADRKRFFIDAARKHGKTLSNWVLDNCDRAILGN